MSGLTFYDFTNTKIVLPVLVGICTLLWPFIVLFLQSEIKEIRVLLDSLKETLHTLEENSKDVVITEKDIEEENRIFIKKQRKKRIIFISTILFIGLFVLLPFFLFLIKNNIICYRDVFLVSLFVNIVSVFLKNTTFKKIDNML